jgi:hypothetical protein
MKMKARYEIQGMTEQRGDRYAVQRCSASVNPVVVVGPSQSLPA